ncbi:hypothetical protein [Legionella sp. PC997]|uniref:hypothetical protein n=1 Tax=Legionella sp. PC997 TaxID=2755562 RepID=UPI0015FDE444|nr:hypothetical protein [Legionella sp. PC997]QMT59982.1 hypothetical protein HBNCFIEN_01351 [Legionella sp. PC997]
MSRLTKIHKKILTNFNNFVSDTNQIQLLANNIELFEAIPNKYLNKLYKTITTFEFAKNNDALLIMAYSYIHYAYENKEATSLNDSLIILDKANHCFQRIIDSYLLLHPSQLNEIHSEHILKANFHLHKIKLLKAEMRLFYIQKEEVNNMSNVASIRKELTNIIDEYIKFKRILESKYKDRTHQAQLSINNHLYSSIEMGLQQARDLLEKLPRNPTAKRQLSETVSEPSQEKSPVVTPLRKKMRQTVENKNESSPADQIPLQPGSNSEHSKPEWEGLAALIVAASNSAPMETPQKPEMIIPSAPQPSLRYIEDSKTFLDKFQVWSKMYFDRHDHYSKLKQTEKSLEKIAHSLLLAAVRLKKESPVFKDKQFNPVVKVAVQFLLFICGVGTQSNFEALEKQNLLSKTYAPILKPFIRSFLDVPHERLIGHLRMQFASEEPSNISFRGLEIQEIIEQLFKLFDTQLSFDDYQRVTEDCIKGLMQANERLVEQNVVESHFTV